MRLAVALLHRLDDLFDRGHIDAIAVEDLVAERNALARHHQRDAHLLAVGAVIATVATLGHGIARRLSLEICARDVMEQKLVVERKQLAGPSPTARFRVPAPFWLHRTPKCIWRDTSPHVG